MRSIILASGSPRRREILGLAGIPFSIVVPKNVDETPRKGEKPAILAKRLALAKAMGVSKIRPSGWVLGADTVVSLGGRIFGKPKDRQEVKMMIHALQGKAHWVYTGVALVRSGKQKRVWVERTKVYFRKLRANEWAPYLSSKEPYDKAGGYAIQGTARSWILGYEGEYFTVLGLPLRWLLAELNRL